MKPQNYGQMEHIQNVPSGKRLHNYGKSPFSMGTLTINDVHSGKRLHNYGKIHDAINW